MHSAPTLRQKDPPGRGYTCRGNRLLDEWAQNEPHGVTEASARVAEACGVSRPFVGHWRGGKSVPPKHWGNVARVTGIPVEEWETWELLVREEPEPASEERPTAEPDVPLGTTADELRRSVQRLERLARKPGITPAQAATAEGKRVTALTALSRLEERAAIADHPDFTGLLEDLVAAVVAELGPDAPEGLEARIADRFEALQTARAAAPERRAA